MSARPGKVCIEGTAEIQGEKVFVLNFIQGRKSDWVKRPFFAKFDPHATWLDQLVPAFGKEFFYETEMQEMEAISNGLLPKSNLIPANFRTQGPEANTLPI